MHRSTALSVPQTDSGGTFGSPFDQVPFLSNVIGSNFHLLERIFRNECMDLITNYWDHNIFGVQAHSTSHQPLSCVPLSHITQQIDRREHFVPMTSSCGTTTCYDFCPVQHFLTGMPCFRWLTHGMMCLRSCEAQYFFPPRPIQ